MGFFVTEHTLKTFAKVERPNTHIAIFRLHLTSHLTVSVFFLRPRDPSSEFDLDLLWADLCITRCDSTEEIERC